MNISCAWKVKHLNLDRFNDLHLSDRIENLAKDALKEINYVRLDTYLVKGIIYFGEWTFAPARFDYKYRPLAFDVLLGEILQNKSGYEFVVKFSGK